ncbi:hypothetical protein LWI29_002534 [Acer saccharum]|uniref:Bifunctional inhibitor/plant lipid transfer protein/seed storage helical domain-containing protein n=1 Tax=Acer saccharum TaxID=4024 RepID=A0AA39T919_ACESA|nr:hypothetical protein LWI29_002534 [Acer saccharum]KAK1588027.1 hypothetical protein Q3G72_019248 [Acer saccharum]
MGTVRNINGITIICVALMMGLCSRVVVSGQGMAPEPLPAGYPMPAEGYIPPAGGPSSEGYITPAGGPSSTSDDCLTKLLNMSDCLSYVMEGSNVTEPDKPCCPELAGLVDSNPICLCELLGKSESYGIKIDMSRALKLPSLCGVTTPSIQLCSAVGIPVGSPTGSEGGLPGNSISPGAAAPGPSTGNNSKNGASSIPTSSVFPILAALAFAFLPSFFSF